MGVGSRQHSRKESQEELRHADRHRNLVVFGLDVVVCRETLKDIDRRMCTDIDISSMMG